MEEQRRICWRIQGLERAGSGKITYPTGNEIGLCKLYWYGGELRDGRPDSHDMIRWNESRVHEEKLLTDNRKNWARRFSQMEIPLKGGGNDEDKLLFSEE